MQTKESVRLVIWDLDETFWQGTLEEGGMALVPSHVDLVRTLSARGIVNSIASKNRFDRVQQVLQAAGVWEHFIFPQVAYEPKGAMVRSIVESAQLRPETVLFIDDNPINLNEVSFHNPGVQVAAPDVIATLLEDARFKGKDDSELSRLQQYQLLERKQVDRTRFADKGQEFLRASEVKLSFHHDVMTEFDRIHELVNRTNQLNFTKARWPEEPDVARRLLDEALQARDCHAGYIRCSDRYGEYGICGFYMVRARRLEHFMFSCRILNMGVEQFVYGRLRRPPLDIVGEVVSDLAVPKVVDWIQVVDDAANPAQAGAGAAPVICLRGACEFDQMAHYLSRFSVTYEMTFPCRGWGIALPLAQFVTVREQLQQQDHRELRKRLPALHPRCLDGALFKAAADAYVLSFALESQWGNYRYRPTGLVMPLRVQHGKYFMEADLTQISYSEIRDKTQIDLSEADWRWFADNFEFLDHFDSQRLEANVRKMLALVPGRRIIVVELNTRFGKSSSSLETNRQINQAVRRAAAGHDVVFVPVDEHIESEAELVNVMHFERIVYVRLAEAVNKALAGVTASGASAPAKPSSWRRWTAQLRGLLTAGR